MATTTSPGASRRTGRGSIAAVPIAVALLAGAGAACSGDADDAVEPTGDPAALSAFETRWSSKPSDEQLLQCRVYDGELAGGPSREAFHQSTIEEDAALADLSFDDWIAFMEVACR